MKKLVTDFIKFDSITPVSGAEPHQASVENCKSTSTSPQASKKNMAV